MNYQNNESRILGLGTWISIGNPLVTELASEFNFDWLLFDLEHGCLQESSLISNFQAVRRKNIHLIVRVGTLNPSLIARVLDWGATGIMIPHVSCYEQAKACVKAIEYPPSGNRGYSGSARVYKYGLNRPNDLNKIIKPLLIVQIEDTDGIKNAETIASVEGVDILFVGPSDLKHSISIHKGKESLSYSEAIQKVAVAARTRKKQAGILISESLQMEKLFQEGFSCFAIDSDLGILKKGYQNIISENNKILQNNKLSR